MATGENAAAHDPFALAAGVPPVQGDLAPKPKVSLGMNPKVIWAVIGVGLVIFGLIFGGIANIDEGGAGGGGAAKEDDKPRDEQIISGLPKELRAERLGSAASVPDASPTANGGTGAVAGGVPGAGPNSVLAGGAGKVPAPGVGGLPPGGLPSAQQQAAQMTPEEQRALQKKLERDQRLTQANLSGLESRPYQSDTGRGVGSGAGDVGGVPSVAKPQAGSGFGGLMGGSPNGRRDDVASDQDEKIAFLKSAGGANGAAVAGNGYHEHTVLPPLSDRQLNAGSLIPAILEMAVNSDLPGQVTAKVRESVHASVNENCMLLPSGSQLVGTYSSKVALGQARQLVVWNRVFFPNGHELNLAGMSSADVSGQAGLDADVDNHFFRLFGVALGMSMVTAGVQLSVGTPPVAASGAVAAPTTAQVVSTALAQQFGQLGGQLFGRYLNVQPTLRNFPGERFNVVVPKSIVFPRCYSR